MNNKVLKTVKKYNMLSKGDRVLIGVSGGADSIALLEFFVSVKEKYDLDICVAHIEHGIRGDHCHRHGTDPSDHGLFHHQRLQGEGIRKSPV